MVHTANKHKSDACTLRRRIAKSGAPSRSISTIKTRARMKSPFSGAENPDVYLRDGRRCTHREGGECAARGIATHLLHAHRLYPRSPRIDQVNEVDKCVIDCLV